MSGPSTWKTGLYLLKGRGVLEFERQSYRRPKMAHVLSRLRFDHGGDTIFFVARSAERARRVWSWPPHQKDEGCFIFRNDAILKNNRELMTRY